MGLVGGTPGYRLLRAIAPGGGGTVEEPSHAGSADLSRCFGEGFLASLRGKTVIDFGCGPGVQAVEMARHGAARVVGLEIQPRSIAAAQARALEAGVQDRCEFGPHTEARADVIVSKDAFEHFDDPAAVLRTMAQLLAPGGVVHVAFGPTWLHPRGGHLFSVFPWAHVVFTEEALLRWRADFKSDGARRFAEVAGGLNQMTIGRFERLVAQSPLRAEAIECVPIGGRSWLRWRPLREFGTSFVRCRLVRR